MLVNCVAYQNGQKLADIAQGEIRDYLAKPGCFVWVALRDSTDEDLLEMQRQFGLHELAVEDARHGHQRPKLEEYGDELFAVLHVLELAGDEIHVGEVNIFTGPNFVLSVRNRTEQGFLGVRARCEREPELLKHGSGYVLYALMDAVVDRYFPVLNAIENELESLEERIFSGKSPRDNMESMYYVKQKLMTVKHAAGPLLEASSKLYGGRVPQMCAGLGEYFRDVYDHLLRLNQSIDSLRETANSATQMNLAMVQIGESEVTKRFAAYAALVAVPTMIAGIYGMNFKHMPELDWAVGYPFSVGLMVVIDAVIFWRFRKADWL
ncbi:MAG: magnesium/cobalt transporter CorA [Proteobacteria bacterium]|nr:magnesium/cobalt transporter CorA [Pseudomonadota bacterium]MDA0982668.1 magnesium/cobalt transporter CorA [Pseudomonadota bacterium]